MDLNVEQGVTVGKIEYNDSSWCYTAAIKSEDGSEPLVRSHHVVLASGLFSDAPLRPESEIEDLLAVKSIMPPATSQPVQFRTLRWNRSR